MCSSTEAKGWLSKIKKTCQEILNAENWTGEWTDQQVYINNKGVEQENPDFEDCLNLKN